MGGGGTAQSRTPPKARVPVKADVQLAAGQPSSRVPRITSSTLFAIPFQPQLRHHSAPAACLASRSRSTQWRSSSFQSSAFPYCLSPGPSLATPFKAQPRMETGSGALLRGLQPAQGAAWAPWPDEGRGTSLNLLSAAAAGGATEQRGRAITIDRLGQCVVTRELLPAGPVPAPHSEFSVSAMLHRPPPGTWAPLQYLHVLC